MTQAKQFSLFIPHGAPVQNEPEITETKEEPAGSSVKVNPYSEAAVEILKNKRHDNKKYARRQISDDFVLKSCRACKGTRLSKIGNVYVCRTCGAENTYSGVLFGEKRRRGDKI